MRLIAATFLALSIACNRAFELKDFTFGDHDYNSLLNVLNETNKKCPDVSRIYSLDEKTVEGRDLVVIEFTAEKPGTHLAGMLFDLPPPLSLSELLFCNDNLKLHKRVVLNCIRITVKTQLVTKLTRTQADL